MQAQSIAYVPTWMRFYERAQAFGAFGGRADLEFVVPALDSPSFSALKSLLDINAMAAAQTARAGDLQPDA